MIRFGVLLLMSLTLVNGQTCPAGEFSDDGNEPCSECPGGKFQPSSGSTACFGCAAGYYCPAGSIVRIDCPAGSYCPDSSSTATVCSAGTYSQDLAFSCTSCPAGTYSSISSTSCTACATGEYSSDSGSSSCTACPDGELVDASATFCYPEPPPTASPTTSPPTLLPTTSPPTLLPTTSPPSASPQPTFTYFPSPFPTANPTLRPSVQPTPSPTRFPTPLPTIPPTSVPTLVPSQIPTSLPTLVPTSAPTATPTPIPFPQPTAVPVPVPTSLPIPLPSHNPTPVPTLLPTSVPTQLPSRVPTSHPTMTPTPVPTPSPIPRPSQAPSPTPTIMPIPVPSALPSPIPSPLPSPKPSPVPTPVPILRPTPLPTMVPIPSPTALPIPLPTSQPTLRPIPLPTSQPTPVPSPSPTLHPSPLPTLPPSPLPTYIPTPTPTHIPTAVGTLSLSTSFDMTVDTVDAPTDAIKLTIEEQIAASLNISIDNILSLTIIVRSESSIPNKPKMKTELLGMSTASISSSPRRRLAESVWLIFFNIVIARNNEYPNILVLSSEVSATMQSTSFADDVGEALDYTVSISDVEVSANSPSDPSGQPTHPPTPSPTAAPTIKTKDKGSEVDQVVLFASVGLGVAVLFVVLIIYFQIYKPRMEANKKWKERDAQDPVLADLELSQKKKRNRRPMKGVTLNALNEGGDEEDGLSQVEMRTLTAPSTSSEKKPPLTPTAPVWSSSNEVVKIEYKKELRIFMGQQDAFTDQGEGMDFAAKCRKKLVTARQLPSKVIKNGEMRDMFEKEVEQLMSLSHVCLQSYFGVCENKGHLCVVFETCGEDSLTSIYQSPDFISKYYQIGNDILEGIAYLHSKNLSHKNLKTKHIFLDQKSSMAKVCELESLKICEFGFVDSGVTNIQPSVYMSPERLNGSCTDYFKDDVYAVGMILCELWTGQQPFKDMNVDTMKSHIASGARPALSRTSASRTIDAPVFLKRLITKCLADDPTERPEMSDVTSLFAVGLSLPPQNEDIDIVDQEVDEEEEEEEGGKEKNLSASIPSIHVIPDATDKDVGGRASQRWEESEDQDEVGKFLSEVGLLQYKPAFLDVDITRVEEMCDVLTVDDHVLSTIIKMTDSEIDQYRRGAEQQSMKQQMKAAQLTALASRTTNLVTQEDNDEDADDTGTLLNLKTSSSGGNLAGMTQEGNKDTPLRNVLV